MVFATTIRDMLVLVKMAFGPEGPPTGPPLGLLAGWFRIVTGSEAMELTMRLKTWLLLMPMVVVSTVAAASPPDAASTDPYADIPRAEALFVDGVGEQIGRADLKQGPNGTLVVIEIDGLAKGPKAIHIHGVGTCDDHEHGFKDSSGHINPDGSSHGLMNPTGPDAGDFPNFYVHEDGYAWVELFNPRASLNGAIGATILDADGAALVIHENPDDHLNQPIGGAGSRIACGVIRAK